MGTCDNTRIDHLVKSKNTQAKKISPNQMIGLGVIIFFSVTLFYSFVISPETGEKILYGKNPPGADHNCIIDFWFKIPIDSECNERKTY